MRLPCLIFLFDLCLQVDARLFPHYAPDLVPHLLLVLDLRELVHIQLIYILLFFLVERPAQVPFQPFHKPVVLLSHELQCLLGRHDQLLIDQGRKQL